MGYGVFNGGETRIYQTARVLGKQYGLIDSQDSNGVSLYWPNEARTSDEIQKAQSVLSEVRLKLIADKIKTSKVIVTNGLVHIDLTYRPPRKKNTYCVNQKMF